MGVVVRAHAPVVGPVIPVARSLKRQPFGPDVVAELDGDVRRPRRAAIETDMVGTHRSQ
jgi:hypothetical protein